MTLINQILDEGMKGLTQIEPPVLIKSRILELIYQENTPLYPRDITKKLNLIGSVVRRNLAELLDIGYIICDFETKYSMSEQNRLDYIECLRNKSL